MRLGQRKGWSMSVLAVGLTVAASACGDDSQTSDADIEEPKAGVPPGPVGPAVASLRPAGHLSLSSFTSCVVMSDETVRCWGLDVGNIGDGKIGDCGPPDRCNLAPTPVVE